MRKPDAYGGPGLVGFNWWLNGIGPEGKRRWPDAPPRTFEAAGYKNNRMWIVPEWGMVIVCLSTEGAWTPDDKVNASFFNI